MQCYKDMYQTLFYEVTQIIERLQAVHQETEEMYLSYWEKVSENLEQ